MTNFIPLIKRLYDTKIAIATGQDKAYFIFEKSTRVKSINKELKNFLKSLSDNSLRTQYIDSINSIQDFDILDRFEQSALNYTYQKKFIYKKQKNEAIRYIIICSAAESFYKLNSNTRGDSNVTFKKFFNFGKTDFKTLIQQKYEVQNVLFNIDENYDEFVKYLYFKRNQAIHEGVHFCFSDSLGYIDFFSDRKYTVNFKLGFDKFIEMFEHILLENLNGAI